MSEDLKAIKNQPCGRRNNRCKGPEAGALAMQSRKMEETKEAGRVRRDGGYEVQEVTFNAGLLWRVERKSIPTS